MKRGGEGLRLRTSALGIEVDPAVHASEQHLVRRQSRTEVRGCVLEAQELAVRTQRSRVAGHVLCARRLREFLFGVFATLRRCWR